MVQTLLYDTAMAIIRMEAMDKDRIRLIIFFLVNFIGEKVAYTTRVTLLLYGLLLYLVVGGLMA